MKPKKTHEKFKQEVYEKFQGNIICLETYIDAKTPIKFHCNKCGADFVKSPNKLLTSKNGCSECVHNKPITHTQFIEIMADKNPNIVILTEYKSIHTKINCKCKICNHEWKVQPSDLIHQNHGCPKCAGLVVYKEEFEVSVKQCNENVSVVNYNGSASKNDFYCSKHDLYFTKKWIRTKPSKICPKCSLESRSGKNHYEWKGGITDIYEHCRKLLDDWKRQVFEKYNYKCALTGETRNLVIHHIEPFYKILMDVHTINNISVKQKVGLYSKEELEIIETYVLEKHTPDMGIVLTERVHIQFHSEYGNEVESWQWFEFYENFHK